MGKGGLPNLFKKFCNISIFLKNCKYVSLLSLCMDSKNLDSLLRFVIINHSFIWRLCLFSLAVVKLLHVPLPLFRECCYLGTCTFEVCFEFGPLVQACKNQGNSIPKKAEEKHAKVSRPPKRIDTNAE